MPKIHNSLLSFQMTSQHQCGSYAEKHPLALLQRIGDCAPKVKSAKGSPSWGKEVTSKRYF
jgi:hypothetical protein